MRGIIIGLNQTKSCCTLPTIELAQIIVPRLNILFFTLTQFTLYLNPLTGNTVQILETRPWHESLHRFVIVSFSHVSFKYISLS